MSMDDFSSELRDIRHLWEDIEEKFNCLKSEETPQYPNLRIEDLAKNMEGFIKAYIKYSNEKRSDATMWIDNLERLKNQCVSLSEKLPDVNWKPLEEKMKLLRRVFDLNEEAQPLTFASNAIQQWQMVFDCENEVLDLIKTIQQNTGLEKMFKRDAEHLEIRRNKLVLACMGTLNAGKSSFINYLLKKKICPVGRLRTTGRLMKVVYGKHIQVQLDSENSSRAKSKLFNSEKDIEAYVRELAVLGNEDRRTDLCRDVIVVTLNRPELKNIEIWDMPGSDENTHLDAIIEEILKDVDIVFALTPIVDDIRLSFENLVKRFLITNKNQSVTICFVLTKADLSQASHAEVNNQLNDIREHVFQSFPQFRREYKHQFVAICTNYEHDLSMYLECYNQFMLVSKKFLKVSMRIDSQLRLERLLSILNEVLDYQDIPRAVQQLTEQKMIVENRLNQFTELLKEQLGEKVKSIIDELFKQNQDLFDNKPITYSKRFEERTLRTFEGLYYSAFQRKENEIKSSIEKVFRKFKKSIDWSANLARILDPIFVAQMYEEHFSVPIGQIPTIPWWDDINELNGFTFLAHKLKEIIWHKAFFSERLAKAANSNIQESVNNIVLQMKNDLSETLSKQLNNTEYRVGKREKKLADIQASPSFPKICGLFKDQTVYGRIHCAFTKVHSALLTVQYSNRHIEKDDVISKKICVQHLDLQTLKYLTRLDHPNLVKIYGIRMLRAGVDQYEMLIQRMKCNLSTYVKRLVRKQQTRPEILDNIAKQILEGIQYLHKHEIIHRNIKPSNILIEYEEFLLPLVRITDYGLRARDHIDIQVIDGYVAPELKSNVDNHQYPGDEKSDMYSIGIIIQRMFRIANPEPENLVKFWVTVSSRCMNIKPGNRPFCQQILFARKKNFPNIE